MKALMHDVKFSGMIISRMRTVSRLLSLCLFFFLLWSGCKESEDPAPSASTAPTLTAFSPTSGTAGTLVTITGSNFSTTLLDNIVKFNSILADVTAATSTSLTVVVPPGASTGKITVEVDNEIATSASDFTILVQPLTLSNFSPATGAAGTVVTLTGTNFSPTATNNIVKFNGTISNVSSATSTSLTVSV